MSTSYRLTLNMYASILRQEFYHSSGLEAQLNDCLQKDNHIFSIVLSSLQLETLFILPSI